MLAEPAATAATAAAPRVGKLRARVEPHHLAEHGGAAIADTAVSVSHKKTTGKPRKAKGAAAAVPAALLLGSQTCPALEPQRSPLEATRSTPPARTFGQFSPAVFFNTAMSGALAALTHRAVARVDSPPPQSPPAAGTGARSSVFVARLPPQLMPVPMQQSPHKEAVQATAANPTPAVTSPPRPTPQSIRMTHKMYWERLAPIPPPPAAVSPAG
jgi:hypothetical protein